MRCLLPLLLAVLLLSCGDDKAKSKTDSTPTIVKVPALKKGEILDLFCFADQSNTYEAYLPTSYDTAKRFPVVIFFDAHGDGRLPVEKYAALAEKWNYIFIGCNSTKNGMEMQQTLLLGNELIEEVKRRFPVDPGEIVLCGFSGGARVASALGQLPSDLKGVICNSAAPQAPTEGKVFIGLAGLGDMNYLEMKKFVDGQKNGGNIFPNELLVFDGKHEWAPVSVMEDAILMANIYDLRNHTTATDSLMAKQLAINMEAQADSIKNKSCLLEASLLEVGVRMCGPYNEAKAMVNKLDPLRKSACFNKDVAAWLKAQDHESALQLELSNALMQQDTGWWRTNSPKYFETKEEGAEKFMRERLRGYASLMAYSYCNQALKVQNPHAADKLITIYSIVDPTNSEWAYMRATFYMLIGMNDYVYPNLEKAVSLGFNDRNRLANDPVFATIQNDAHMNDIFASMK